MKLFVRLLIIPALILLIGVACGFSIGDVGTEEPSVVPTVEVVAPVEEEPVEEEVVVESEPYFTQEFDEEPADWSYFVQSGNEKDVNFYVDNGRMNVEINAKETYIYFTYDAYTYDNVAISTVVENRGVNSQAVTLVCRMSDAEGWYEVNIQNDGMYFISVFDARSKGYNMLTSGGSNAIRQGKDINEYGLECVGNELTVYINGKKVTTFKDNTYKLREGVVGISVSSFDVFPVVVEFDSVTISEP